MLALHDVVPRGGSLTLEEVVCEPGEMNEKKDKRGRNPLPKPLQLDQPKD